MWYLPCRSTWALVICVPLVMLLFRKPMDLSLSTIAVFAYEKLLRSHALSADNICAWKISRYL